MKSGLNLVRLGVEYIGIADNLKVMAIRILNNGRRVPSAL